MVEVAGSKDAVAINPAVAAVDGLRILTLNLALALAPKELPRIQRTRRENNPHLFLNPPLCI